jgi:hypothetical protein
VNVTRTQAKKKGAAEAAPEVIGVIYAWRRYAVRADIASADQDRDREPRARCIIAILGLFAD